jgi:sulfide dehydrogenase cytochrome subunit
MKLKRSWITVTAVVASALALSACQTTPSPAPGTAAKPAQAKPAEAAKPITPEMAGNLANNCFTCHGPNGRSPGSIPSIVTLSSGDIAAKLKRFKSGEAPSTVMGRQAKGYTDAEIDAVANYIAGLKK